MHRRTGHQAADRAPARPTTGSGGHGRRLVGLVVAVVTLALLPAVAAIADPGVTFVDEFVYEDVHPCTGEPRTVDSVYTITLNEHVNGATIVIEMRSVASDGTVERGVQVINDNHRRGFLRGHFTTNNVDEDGNRFIGHARWVIDGDTGELDETRHYTCPGPHR